jgi:hypothetical protein
MDKNLRRELERLALDEAPSGRAKLAKIEALRLLERLDREAGDYPRDGVTGRFHPSRDPGWWELDASDSDEVREAWRARSAGGFDSV